MPDALDVLTEALLPRLVQAQGRRYGIKHDASGTPQSVGYSHGPGGNLSFPGVDPTLFHAVMGASSMLGMLPATPSEYTNPTYYTITGVQDITGAEKTAVCANAPSAGLMKACLTTSVFGRYERATTELELNRLGQRNDRADPMDLTLVGSPLDTSGIFGGPRAGTPGDLLTNEVARKFWELSVSFHRLLSLQLWQGNPDNNNAAGAYKEMTSFSVLVNTGYVDAENGVACPAVDSYVANFGSARIDSNSQAFVAALTNIYYQLKDRAFRMGMTPVRWVIAMRPQLFYEVSALWPCAYLTYRCQTTASSNERVVIDSTEQIRMRDEMRAGRYLLIDGERVEVVLDDGIAETDGNEGAVPRGCFSSDIYFIPMSVVGGRAVTYMEYLDYNNPSLSDALSGANMILGRAEGPFLTWPRQTNQCVVWQSKTEPRLVMRTPWLAGRLRNVLYCPIQHTRDAFPADSYFADGGRTSRQGPSYYNIWQSS